MLDLKATNKPLLIVNVKKTFKAEKNLIDFSQIDTLQLFNMNKIAQDDILMFLNDLYLKRKL